MVNSMSNSTSAFKTYAPVLFFFSLAILLFLFSITEEQNREYNQLKSNFEFATQSPHPKKQELPPEVVELRARELERNPFLVKWLEEDALLWEEINANKEAYAASIKKSFTKLCLYIVLTIAVFTLFIFTLPSIIIHIYDIIKSVKAKINLDSPSKRIGFLLFAISSGALAVNFSIYIFDPEWTDESFLSTWGIRGIVAWFLLISLCMGILLLTGFAQNLINWIKTGKTP